jgi:hypothetical protein
MGGSNFGYTDSGFGRMAFCQGQDLRVAENFNDLVRTLKLTAAERIQQVQS